MNISSLDRITAWDFGCRECLISIEIQDDETLFENHSGSLKGGRRRRRTENETKFRESLTWKSKNA